MRFLDVCRNPDAEQGADHPLPFLLVVQGDLVMVRSSRVVVPLVRAAAAGAPIKGLMPVFEIGGERVVMMTPQIAGVSIHDLGDVVANLSERRHEIRTAIDILTGDL